MNDDQTDKPLKTLQEIKTDQTKNMCKHRQEEGGRFSLIKRMCTKKA